VSAALPADRALRRARFRARLPLLLCFIPPLAYFLIFVLLPYVNVFRFSFWRVDNYAIVRDFTLDNYARALENPLYLSVIGNSLEIALIVTAFSSILGYLLALHLVTHAGRLRQFLYFLIVIPLWTSFLLRAFIWRIILGREGVINSALEHFGLTSDPLTFLLFSKFSLCVGLIYIFIPFVALPVFTALERIPQEYGEASLDLGQSPLETFWRVILPLSLPGLIAGATFTFCLSFGDFVAPALLGGPNGAMISGIIISQFGAGFDWPFGSALAVIVIGIVGASVLLMARLERRA
jgi:spermidine/putrescine transport system permease protein